MVAVAHADDFQVFTSLRAIERTVISFELTLEATPFGILENVDGSSPAAIEVEEMAAAQTQAFQWKETLSLIGVMLLGGLTLYGFIDSKIDKINDKMSDVASEQALQDIREELRKSREDMNHQFELLRKEMRDDRIITTNAILDLQKQQGRLGQSQ
ncbi:hypothetical protein A6723_024135 [Pseudomonas sp. AU11447]|uniref:hypothetical protein n=1 Tax=Pseudomonas sp. AU11447 TaxID=1843184 RepID=UPI0007ED14AA|nr:hypothetical protein [Pseudomonas sp. AU11447]OBY91149.1 hypothetical protein A6723_024135 [Pseudomonas sp. AU11447]